MPSTVLTKMKMIKMHMPNRQSNMSSTTLKRRMSKAKDPIKW
uniref:Uncharacterized protein n=1 Tax=Acrobeloides nanus TaxID=290746 RepID=A0A914DNX8_9BILA